MTYLFTSESVTEGHPDKVCDQISDAILDAALEQDANSRVAAETVASGDTIHVVGEIRSAAVLDVESIVRDTLRKIGYTAQFNLDPDTVKVNVALIQQSPDISNGVDRSLEARDGDEDILDQLGAGDQGLMFGYATAETEQLIALPALLSSLLAQRIAKVRHEGIVSGLGPDAKTQVTVEYEEQGGNPSRIHTVLVSSQHVEELTQNEIYDSILTHVIEPIMGEYAPSLWNASTARILINPSGRFVLGGPAADAGLTGRKIIVDTYGGAAPHGGGCFSGKDPSKVDRSGAYAARWVAKSIVASGLATKALVQVAYAIGTAHPISVDVQVEESPLTHSEWIAIVSEVFDLRPAAIIRDLDLLKPQYAATAAYGHFGRCDMLFPWEDVSSKVDEIRAAAERVTRP